MMRNNKNWLSRQKEFPSHRQSEVLLFLSLLVQIVAIFHWNLSAFSYKAYPAFRTVTRGEKGIVLQTMTNIQVTERVKLPGNFLTFLSESNKNEEFVAYK